MDELTFAANSSVRGMLLAESRAVLVDSVMCVTRTLLTGKVAGLLSSAKTAK